MGKTIVKQSDVEKLYELIQEKSFGQEDGIEHDDFIAAVDEVFGVDISEREQTFDELCSQITDENKPELIV